MKLDPTAIQLRVVPLEQVTLHEDFDPWRVRRLAVSLRRDGVLKNPPIATECLGRFIVLDGATRVRALQEMGVPDVVLQLVDYENPHIRLRTWHHVIVGMPGSVLLSELSEIPDLASAPCRLDRLTEELRARSALIGVVTGDGQAVAFPSRASAVDQVAQLSRAVAAYRGKAEVHRASEIDLPALAEQYPDLSAVVLFPPFRPAEVLRFALNGAKLPMGITRHLIGGRALGINVTLEFLSEARALEEKNERLREMLHDRIRHNRVRLYEEPTFVFDD